MGTTVIDVRELVVRRGRREVLRGLSFTVPRGTVVGVLGPSGSGKSTLLRAVVGTQVVTSGEVHVLGHRAGDAPLRHSVGYVTQSPSVYSDLTVRENARYHAALHRLGRDAAERALVAVGLDPTTPPTSSSPRCRAGSRGGRRWRARSSAPPTCWCSTSQRSASIRFCGNNYGKCSVRWRPRGPRCWCPAT